MVTKLVMDDLEVDDLMIMDVPASQLVQLALEHHLNAVASVTSILPCLVFPQHSPVVVVDTCLVAAHMAIDRSYL